jgi:NAD(P)-dependent dehydrogenase (short-subunit alcohol dehydrogenase family)
MMRSAVVTGVSRRNGIGFAVARRLLEAGNGVLIHSWASGDENPDPGGVEAVIAELEQAGGPVAHVEADFTNPAAPAAVLRAAREAFGHVDILIVNHSLERRGTLAELTADDLDAQFQVNIRAPLLLVKEFAGEHDGRAGGRVVMFTSGQHRAPMRSEVAYAAAKGALHQVTLTLSDELIERGITVNTICPGPTDTGWIPEDWDPRARNPLGRWGQPDDAARLIAWLCSDEGEWVTGQVIDSEGGFRRWG